MALKTRSFGTPVRCRACKHPNLAIDIWCEHCGAPLDWKKEEAPAATTRRATGVEAAAPVSSPPVLHALPAQEAPSLQPARWPESAATPVEPEEERVSQPPQPRQERASEPLAAAAPPSSQFCWSCGARNQAGDGFCSSCGAALGAKTGTPAPAAARGGRPAASPFPALALPSLRLPRWQLPRLTMPAMHAPRLRLQAIPRTAWIVALILAMLLMVPLAYVLLPSARTVARQPATSHLPSTNANPVKPGTPEAVAIAVVEAKTGLKYSSSCAGTTPCLSITGKTVGQDAAAYVFSTAKSGGRQCAGYVYQAANAWHQLSALCGLPGQVAPLVGRDAKVHVPGNCANVRSSASRQGGVVACLYDGTSVHVDGGPTYADSLMWWHVTKGWMAQDFLAAP